MAIELRDDATAHHLELVVDGTVVAFEAYALDGDRIELLHTEVLEGNDGKGYGRALVDAVLADARARGLGVLPSCPFVRKVIREHPDEYLDLVPADVREAFGLPPA